MWKKPSAEMSIKPEPLEFREPVGVLNFPKSKTGEIYFDKTEDSMYVSDNMMEKISQSLPFKREETVEQAKLITHVEKEPEPEENIIGQYKNTYILIERTKVWKSWSAYS